MLTLFFFFPIFPYYPEKLGNTPVRSQSLILHDTGKLVTIKRFF